MLSSSEAARDLSVLAVEARKRNTAAVKRIMKAYRRLHYADAGRSDGDILELIADDLERQAGEARAAAS